MAAPVIRSFDRLRTRVEGLGGAAFDGVVFIGKNSLLSRHPPSRMHPPPKGTPLVLSLSKDTMERTAPIHHALEGPPQREPCALAFDG